MRCLSVPCWNTFSRTTNINKGVLLPPASEGWGKVRRCCFQFVSSLLEGGGPRPGLDGGGGGGYPSQVWMVGGGRIPQPGLDGGGYPSQVLMVGGGTLARCG